jgi:hypothetical protein
MEMNTKESNALGMHVRLNAIESLVQHDFSNIKDFIDVSERLLQKELESLTERMHEETHCLPLIDRQEVTEWYADEISQLSEEFPRIQRYSLFVLVMARIEDHIHGICGYARQVCGHELKDTDLIGRGLVRSVAYSGQIGHPFRD